MHTKQMMERLEKIRKLIQETRDHAESVGDTRRDPTLDSVDNALIDLSSDLLAEAEQLDGAVAASKSRLGRRVTDVATLVLGHVFRPMDEDDKSAFAGADPGTRVCYPDGAETTLLLTPEGTIVEVTESDETEWQSIPDRAR